MAHYKKIIAGTIGNILEWYDFLIYGFFAAAIAREFFPAENEYTSLLISLATFGVGFFTRPLGGILIGMYADKYGRRKALQLIIWIMFAAVFIFVVTPSYHQIGIAASVLLIIARLMQGFATGGEYASSTAYLVEGAEEGKKTYYGSWQLFGQCFAVILASLISGLIFKLPQVSVDSWGWRAAFAVGLIICPVGIWIRNNLSESEEFTSVRKAAESRPATRNYDIANIIKGFGLIVSGTVSFYVLLINMPGFASKQLNLPIGTVLNIQIAVVVLMAVLIPFLGMVGDKVGRKRLFTVSTLAYFVLVMPLFKWLVNAPDTGNLFVMQLILGVCLAGQFATMPTMLTLLFPVKNRATSLSISYNLATMTFGGFSPFIVTWMSHTWGVIAPGYYMFGVAAISLVAGLCFPRDKKAVSMLVSGQPDH